MKMRAGLLVTCAASALVIGIGIGFASPALAANKMVTKAPAAEALPWWYEGFVEVGGRFDLNKPDKKTLGKFYEYRDLRPGVFGNFYIAAHNRTNPIDFAVWGTNVGYNDQAFGLDYSKVGEHYLSLGWDETPHVFSQNAKTLYDGVGTNNLTIPLAVRTALSAATPSAAAKAIIDANSKTIDVGYRRDTGSAKYRWTPSDAWDVNADYTHTHREGTQPLGAVSFSGAASTRSTFELPKPVDDVTQNANLKGEYAGSTPWGKPYNVALGSGVSAYNAADDSLVFQNPWNAVNTVTRPVNNRYSLAPDNKAQTLNLSGGVGLPFNSRYMGTAQYTRMQVDNSSLAWTINPLVPAVAFTTPNRDASTTLFNNVLHTQITSDLKSTLRYRYYDYNTANDSPVIVSPPWYRNPDTNGSALATVEERPPINFTKQNANAELTWRALKWLTVGAAYDWERWDRVLRDVAVTNENTGKVFADAKWDWSTLRASLQFGERRYDQYINVVAANNDAYRMKDLANRDRTRGVVSWAIEATPMITITPNGGFLNEDYLTDVYGRPAEIGLKHARSWNAGPDVTLNVNRNVALFVSYNYENSYRQVYQNSAAPDLNIESRDRIDTFMFGSKVTVIPEKLFVDANYTYTRSTSKWDLSCGPFGCRYTPLATFPDSHNTLHRVDVQAKYMLEDSFTRNAGWAGKAYVKARLLWEKNSNDAWQPLQDQMGWLVDPSAPTTAYSMWMGTGNPNYNVVLGQLSFGVKW